MFLNLNYSFLLRQGSMFESQCLNEMSKLLASTMFNVRMPLFNSGMSQHFWREDLFSLKIELLIISEINSAPFSAGMLMNFFDFRINLGWRVFSLLCNALFHKTID